MTEIMTRPQLMIVDQVVSTFTLISSGMIFLIVITSHNAPKLSFENKNIIGTSLELELHEMLETVKLSGRERERESGEEG